VIVAERTEGGTMPSTVDDELWDEVDRFYVPLVGQIVVAPRRFDPRVDGIWVQALHDGEEIALLLSWTDPSNSPDPGWAEFAEWITSTIYAGDEGSQMGPAGPDQITVQFPQALPSGMARPFFLQGDARRPAYLWSWRSDSGVTEEVARGLGTAEPQAASAQQVTAEATHEAGQWKVLLRRALVTDDLDDLALEVGQAPPVAFQAWDGDHGEGGTQGAISTWYFLALEPETPVTVLVAPAAALFLTFGFGLFVVSMARKEDEGRWTGQEEDAVAVATD